MKMANTAVVIARCIAGDFLTNIARSRRRDFHRFEIMREAEA
jgi:hypothetical protein